MTTIDRDYESEPSPSPVKRGRPSKGDRISVTVRFTETETEMIRREARATGRTYSEIVRGAVQALHPLRTFDGPTVWTTGVLSVSAGG